MMIPEALNVIPGLWDFASRLRSDLINNKGFLYAVDFEARLNLDILGALKVDELKGKAASPAFAELVNSFETSATLALVAGSDRKDWDKLLSLLKKNWKKTAAQQAEDKNSASEEILDCLDALSFAARKIEALKRLAAIAGKDPALLKELNLKTRLNNLKAALLDVHNCLAAVIKTFDNTEGKRTVKR